MPLPRRLGQINRRVTNRVTGRIAGWMPGFAIVLHTGRRSGRTYRTPVNAFRIDGGYRIALTYGAESDWVRNVMAADGCEIVTRGKRISLTHPRILSDPSRHWALPVVRQLLGVADASEYMLLAEADESQNAQ